MDEQDWLRQIAEARAEAEVHKARAVEMEQAALTRYHDCGEARALCRSWWAYVKLCHRGDFEEWANTYAPDAREIEEEYPWIAEP